MFGFVIHPFPNHGKLSGNNKIKTTTSTVFATPSLDDVGTLGKKIYKTLLASLMFTTRAAICSVGLRYITWLQLSCTAWSKCTAEMLSNLTTVAGVVVIHPTVLEFLT